MKGWALSVVAVACAGGFAQSQSDTGVNRLNDVFRAEKDAYALWPAEYIVGPSVSWATWSPSGKSVLGCLEARRLTERDVVLELLGMRVELPAAPEVSLFVWSKEGRPLEQVWRGSNTPAGETVQWIGKSETALVSIYDLPSGPNPPDAMAQTVCWIDAAGRRSGTVLQAVTDEQTTAFLSALTTPSVPYALVFGVTGTGAAGQRPARDGAGRSEGSRRRGPARSGPPRRVGSATDRPPVPERTRGCGSGSSSGGCCTRRPRCG